jgi:multiple sugar transport system substrate-binding protein
MKKIRVIAIILILACALSLTACGQGTSATVPSPAESSAGNTDAQAKDPATPAPDKEVTLSFMGWEASPLETESVKQGIAAFQEQYPHIKVEYTPGLAGAEYSAKLLTMFAGNAAPDVFFCGDSDYRTFASKGVLYDITDKFDATFPVDDFIDSSKTIMNIDGKYFGISSCTVSPILYYNKAIFDKAGIAYPSSDPDEAMTWEEYRALSLQLTIKNGDKTEQYGTYGLESWLMTPMLYSNNASLFDKDFTKTTINTPEAAEVFDAIRDLRIVDGSAPDATTLENIGMSAAQMLQTGKVATLVDGSWALQQLATLDFEVGMAPLPKFDNALTTGSAHLHSIWADTPHPDETWEFLKFLSGYDYQGALVASGLWMPNRKSMYLPDGVAQWYRDDVHGDSYKDMLPYFQEAMAYPGALWPSSKLGSIIDEERSKYFKDGQSTEETLANIQTRCDEELLRVN